MKRAPLIAALIGLAGCSSGAGFHDLAQRDAAMAAFRSGQASLPCGDGLECGLKWATAKRTVENYGQAGNWNGVAEAVLSVGYDNDLAWYYLGTAAQNLGFNNAARVYYQASIQRTTAGGLAACDASFDLCGSATLPIDAQRALASIPAARVGTSDQRVRQPTKAKAPAAEAAAAPAWETPSQATNSAWQSPPQASPSQTPKAAASGWESPK